MVLKLVSKFLQIDRPLVYALGARAWQSISGPVTAVFLISSLTPATQGVYYTLVSIISTQIFFELGLLNVLISQAGNLLSKLSSESGRQQMQALIVGATKWFLSASVLFAILSFGLGYSALSGEANAIQWVGPLASLVVMSSLTVAVSPTLAILEGAGYREEVYRYRLWQGLAGSLVMWVSLGLGLNLWALVASAAVQLICSCYLAYVRHRDFFEQFRALSRRPNGNVESEFSWAKNIVPLQWRSALLSVVYHVATQLFPLILMLYHGSDEAGRMGMTLSLSAGIQALAMAWIQTKFSMVSAEHGANNREVAGNLWRHAALISTGLLILGLVVAVGLLGLLPWLGHGLENRFLRPWQFAILGFGCVANHVVALEALYVLSRRANPLLRAMLVGLVCTALAVWLGGYVYATTGLIVGYTLSMCLILLPLHTWAYMRFRLKG
jgi:hypothetical protein